MWWKIMDKVEKLSHVLYLNSVLLLHGGKRNFPEVNEGESDTLLSAAAQLCDLNRQSRWIIYAQIFPGQKRFNLPKYACSFFQRCPAFTPGRCPVRYNHSPLLPATQQLHWSNRSLEPSCKCLDQGHVCDNCWGRAESCSFSFPAQIIAAGQGIWTSRLLITYFRAIQV